MALKSIATSLWWFAILTTLRLCSKYTAADGRSKVNECLTEHVAVSFIRFFLICILLVRIVMILILIFHLPQKSANILKMFSFSVSLLLFILHKKRISLQYCNIFQTKGSKWLPPKTFNTCLQNSLNLLLSGVFGSMSSFCVPVEFPSQSRVAATALGYNVKYLIWKIFPWVLLLHEVQ